MIPAEVFAETLLHFFAPIRPYLEDPGVSDIVVNGPHQIFIERRGELELAPVRFESAEELMAALRNLAQFVGKHVDEARPILEARLPDGARVEAVLPPAAPDGPHVAIRKFPPSALTIARLIELDSLTPLAADTLAALVGGKMNVLVAGGTGTGKTSLLNALSSFIPNKERVVVIEDSKEVQLQRLHVIHFEARPGDAKGRGQVSIRDLFRATLRMRPDRVVIGEIRGGEALDIIQAMTSGHGGCLGTLHATFPRDTLSRLETMAMMSSVDMPLAALRTQIASAVNIIVQAMRFPDGSRKITHISEVLGFDASSNSYRLQDIFIRRYMGAGSGAAPRSELVPSGRLPACLPHLRDHGFDVPPALHHLAEHGPRLEHDLGSDAEARA
jgi:pilus assembly protein CpaF